MESAHGNLPGSSQVSIPHDIQVPSDATHLAVAAENEDGEGGGDQIVAMTMWGILRRPKHHR